MRQQRTSRQWLHLVLPLALTGCLSLPSSGAKDASSIYTLRASASASAAAAAKTPTPAQARGREVVVVPKPELPAGLGTERIALYLQEGRKLDYYADAKWSARLDDLLQDYVIQRAKQDLPGKVVGTPDLAPSARYRLALKVTDFGPVYADMADKAPRLDVALTATVIALPGETVKTQFTVKKSSAASANSLTAITNELGTLLASATDETLQKARPYF